MSLRLSDQQLREIRELQELLSTPLRFSRPESWYAAVHQQVTGLFGVDRSLLVIPMEGRGVMVDSPNMEMCTLDRLREAILDVEPNVNRYDDPALNRAMHRLATAGTEVWSREIAERVSRIPFDDMPRFYPEVVKPARLEGLLAMGHSLEKGRAMLQIVRDRPGGSAFGADDEKVFHLLLPCFKVGTRALALSGARQRTLRASLDTLQEGVMLFRSGSDVFRNRALRGILQAEPCSDELMAAVKRCADVLSRRLARARPRLEGPDAPFQLTTPWNRYRLVASHLEGGTDGRPAVVMVVVRPAVPPLPDASTLQKRYGLTPRQAEVALLVAAGRSNREVAEALEISHHTARHHAQRALEKIGAQSRKALAMRMLEDRRL
ncbi:MAG: helix-turn-helix transcriptional regulator [Longimicrobiales bacterium]|nr:helix-turn-helix transcriptional regulator [Longimicrobiales bacterium]